MEPPITYGYTSLFQPVITVECYDYISVMNACDPCKWDYIHMAVGQSDKTDCTSVVHIKKTKGFMDVHPLKTKTKSYEIRGIDKEKHI